MISSNDEACRAKRIVKGNIAEGKYPGRYFTWVQIRKDCNCYRYKGDKEL